MPEEEVCKKIFLETRDPFIRWAVVDAYLLDRFIKKWRVFWFGMKRS